MKRGRNSVNDRLLRRAGKLWWGSALFFDAVLSAIVFLLTRRLFLYQIEFSAQYPSDIGSHIASAMAGDAYSINSIILRLSNRLGGNAGIAVYLALVVVLTMWAAAWMLRELLRINGARKVLPMTWTFVFSAPLVFLSSIYVPKFYGVFYYAADNRVTDFTQPWHNSTYLLMRLFAVIVIALYFRIQSRYLKKTAPVEWIAFLLALLAVNAAKPNFFLAFAPAALCFFIYDLIKNRELKRVIVFGIPFLLSLPVLLFQSGVVYGGAEGEQSGIEISLALFKYVIQNRIFLPHLIAGASFVLFVTLLCVIHREGRRSLWFGWVTHLFGFIARWFIMETGPRATHGNFTWGAKCTAYLLALICVERLIAMKEAKKISVNAFLGACVLLFLMIGSGVVYFAMISQGMDYLM